MASALKVSLIVIGDEILNGRTADLNGKWLAKFAFQKGMQLINMHFINDAQDEIKKALQSALENSDIVITSGGIGPTLDDKTKATLADFFGKEIKINSQAKKVTEENYARFQRTWTPTSNFYHHFPEDFFPVNNPKGFAPGLGFLHNQNQLIFSAPGVPREFVCMVEEEFFPQIKKQFPKLIKDNFQTTIRTHSIPEEKIFYDLCPNLWKDLEVYGKVSSLPHVMGIDIVVTHHSINKSEYQTQFAAIKKLVESTPIKDNIWQYGTLSLPELIIQKALDKKITFSFAESCTGGLCASKITDISGSSQVFYGGIVSYDNSIKENVLGVKKETLKEFGAVSIETATEMAAGARRLTQTTFCISTSGIAGPGGGSDQKPVGTIAIGFSTPTTSQATLHHFTGDRIRLKDRFSDFALLKLLELIETN